MTADEDLPTMNEYFQQDGTIGIFVQLPHEGLLNNELDKKVHISHTTLSDRLTTGMELGLLEQTRNPDDHGNSKRYLLTKKGSKVQDMMLGLGLDDAYEQFFEAYTELETGRAKIDDWVESSHIDDPRWPPDNDPDDAQGQF